MIYLDNAATSWPKPEEVYNAVNKAMRESGGNSGRGTHSMSLAAKEQIYVARMLCANLFHVSKPECICFTFNATEALNLAIKGVLNPGDHVVTSCMEHNSVARPLKKLESAGIRTTKVSTSPETGIDLVELEKALAEKPNLMVCTHISNVTGTINPIKEIGALCKKYGVLFLVDAAQSAGMKKINVEDNNIDMLAFPGHKGLFGPQGTGGLYIRDGLTLETLIEGGTGSQSEKYDQPEQKPDRYE
ncbi:MAG: aminotransferase class V-fold PLP-dependent enzyme, partial [Bacillota bacterium]